MLTGCEFKCEKYELKPFVYFCKSLVQYLVIVQSKTY